MGKSWEKPIRAFRKRKALKLVAEFDKHTTHYPSSALDCINSMGDVIESRKCRSSHDFSEKIHKECYVRGMPWLSVVLAGAKDSRTVTRKKEQFFEKNLKTSVQGFDSFKEFFQKSISEEWVWEEWKGKPTILYFLGKDKMLVLDGNHRLVQQLSNKEKVCHNTIFIRKDYLKQYLQNTFKNYSCSK